jgi:hypothetical protein
MTRFFKIRSWIARLGTHPSPPAQPDPTFVGSRRIMHVDGIVSELQPGGMGVQWRVRLTGENSDRLTVDITEGVALQLQKDGHVEVKIRLLL